MGLALFENHGAVRVGRFKDLRSLSDERLIEYWMRLLRWRDQAAEAGRPFAAELQREEREYGDEFERRVYLYRRLNSGLR